MQAITWIIVFVCATVFLSYLMTAGQTVEGLTFAHLLYAAAGGMGIAGWATKQVSS